MGPEINRQLGESENALDPQVFLEGIVSSAAIAIRSQRKTERGMIFEKRGYLRNFDPALMLRQGLLLRYRLEDFAILEAITTTGVNSSSVQIWIGRDIAFGDEEMSVNRLQAILTRPVESTGQVIGFKWDKRSDTLTVEYPSELRGELGNNLTGGAKASRLTLDDYFGAVEAIHYVLGLDL